MTHVEYPRDVGHRQTVLVGLADGAVPIFPKPLGEPAKFGVTATVILGKGA